MIQSVHLHTRQKPSSNRSPYIFKLVQKVNIGYIKFILFLTEAILCRDSASYFIKKNTCTSCEDEARGKLPSFQKVTIFIRYKP